MRSRRTVWAFRIVGALIIGALGNALWEVARPVVLWLGSRALDLSTFGLTTLVDAIYVEVARGTHERASTALFSLAIGAVCVTAVMLHFLPRVSRRLDRLKSDLDKLTPDEVEQKINRKIIVFQRLSLLCTVGLVMFGTLQNVRLVYIVRAANHMEQLQRVIAPYVTDEYRLRVASRFASMTTRDQYIVITREIEAIARTQKVNLPSFDIY